jgi:hypothetical protein
MAILFGLALSLAAVALAVVRSRWARRTAIAAMIGVMGIVAVAGLSDSPFAVLTWPSAVSHQSSARKRSQLLWLRTVD